MLFPHLPNAVSPTLTNDSLSTLLNTSNRIPMAHFNNIDDTGFYAAFSMSNELEAYPFLNHWSSTQEFGYQTNDALTDHWSMPQQPELQVGSPANLWATSYGKYCCYLSLSSILRMGSQSQWLQPPRVRTKPMVLVSHRTQTNTGRRLATSPSLTIPTS